MQSELSIPMSSITKELTCEITLTGMKTQEVRFWLGCQLFKIAAWVTGMKGKITVGDSNVGEIK